MFTSEYRARVREWLLARARDDARIESGAAVGGSAWGEKDRWSDLDLTFGLAEGASLPAVLDDWTRGLREQFDAVTLFDLPFRSSLYRVFLLPGSLQVDLSFTPGRQFGALGPRFELLFGTAVDQPELPPASARQMFGLGAHHAVRAKLCIERGRLWQAEYWISGVRDQALMVACSRLGLEHELGRGFDALPDDIRDKAARSLVREVDPDELQRALRAAVELLATESIGVHEDHGRVESMLRELVG